MTPSPAAPIIYGAALRGEWTLAPEVAYLNHGGYGATPKPVLAAQAAWRERIERNPTAFLARAVAAAVRDAAAEIAAALGAQASELVFVENATAGVNAVLRSLAFAPGDEILVTSLTYPATRNAARFAAERVGARLVEAQVKLPVADLTTLFNEITSALGKRTRLAIFDHIASASALVLPVAEMTEAAHAMGALVLIDGAHAPGQIALDLPAVGAEWYVGNLHKWLFAPRACGVLWAPGSAQRELHPLAISHGLGGGFAAEFDWTGTRDFSASLAAPAGLAFHRRLGGAALMARNAGLARQAAARLAERWGTETAGPLAGSAAMATVRLPATGEASTPRARAIAGWLGEAHGIEAAVFSACGALWLRVAAQAYNEPAEYERLAEVIKGAALP